MNVAFLGLGAMGSRMARHLAAVGVPLRVWSRSGTPASLSTWGAGSLRDAVTEADVVLSMLRDDEASRAVWDEAIPALRPGAIVVEHSTLSPGWVRELSGRVTLVDAPVVGSRPQADAHALVFLAGGEEPLIERVRPLLLHMGAALHHLGPSGSGATAKLLVNALFAAQVAALGELLGAARHAGLDPETFAKVLGELPVTSPAAKGASRSMLDEAFEPQFPIELVRKDLRYAAALAEMPVIARVAERFAEANPDENITAIARLSVR